MNANFLIGKALEVATNPWILMLGVCTVMVISFLHEEGVIE